MKLTKRLEKIASLVDKDVRLGDVGTDHGYIPVYLLERNIIKYAILSDVNKGPLENAASEVKKMKLEDKTELRLGGGLSVYKVGEVDEIIIAGMGGILISEIIKADLDICKTVSKLILQPMQAQDELRKYLLNNNFEIIEEHMENEDFRIYEIIEAKYNPKFTFEGDEIEFEIPKKLLEKKNPLLKKSIEKKILECDGIIRNLMKTNNKSTRIRLIELENRKSKLEEIIRYFG